MVFDKPPNNNLDVPFYFIKKLYAEFLLGHHVNYFDIRPFQGVGGGMPQDREGAVRVIPRPHVPLPPLPPPPPVYHPDIMQDAATQTIHAIHSLSGLLVSHASVVAQPHSGDVGDGSSAAASSSSGPHICVPHTCSMCRQICLGPLVEPAEHPLDTSDYDFHDVDIIDQTQGSGAHHTESSLAREGDIGLVTQVKFKL